MPEANDIPLMRDLPRGLIPDGLPLVLASGSPRRAQLLKAAGYEFSVDPAGEGAECGVCSRETAPELVARYAFRKAADVIPRHRRGVILAADTVASCYGRILGKPRDAVHAAEMLRLLRGRRHDVFTGVCLWSAADGRCVVDVVRTRLEMDPITDAMLAEYLESMRWEGKAGAFGYQDGNDWLRVAAGESESNVVGLPMERLEELLENFDSLAETVNVDSLGDEPGIPLTRQRFTSDGESD